MTNSPTVVRSFLIYAICLPVALLLGYMLATPLEWGSFITIGVVLGILLVPLLLRFHHPLLILGWNASMIIFFLPGAPNVWLPLVLLSLLISIVRRAVDQNFRFISVPMLTWPFLALMLIVIVTAEARGGIKLRSLGGEIYGGKRYVLMIAGILGYFALTAEKVPLKRAGLYVGLFYLSLLTSLVGDLFGVISPEFRFIFWMFPPSSYVMGEITTLRLAGLGMASVACLSFMMARFGLRGIFRPTHPFRFIFFVCFAFASLLGGFRSVLLSFALLFTLQFFLEGLHRTKLFPVFIVSFALVLTISFSFADRMPRSIQRALSIFPVSIDPVVRADAEGSWEWRVKIWKAVLPEVPGYLLLGKGLGLTPQDYEFSAETYIGAMKESSEDQSWAALAGDYHSGPLSVIIPFGIWGVGVLIWLFIAGWRVVYRNYRYGDPALRTTNTLLFAAFITKSVVFIFLVGGFYGDLQAFAGILGLSVCLNGGVAQPSAAPATEPVQGRGFAGVTSRPLPAFGRAR